MSVSSAKKEADMYTLFVTARFENDSDDARPVRDQLAAAHTGFQFCVHTFTVFIRGQSTRFIRWDHNGTCYPELRLHRKTLPTFSSVPHISIITNPAHREFRILMVPDSDDPTVEKRATRPTLGFDVEMGGIVTIGERMWMEWRKKAKFTPC
ncbi:hypothetical protein PILCRDRAFT_15306 [Piloderma croceum F 1598]|uniref:Fungal-type protein kinase domain-containing protein n=1 Tax=Piloderma croceum (strain F 1598) TaxID=765440 RepID=A0A0C3B7Q0_PILCF|nr:hypothetical protein PILCRDRAFT_15306 [Piloderma croceum F 1598]